MTDNAILIVAGGCLGGSFFLSTAAYSLRNFSRSRLQQMCRDRNRTERFGEILKQDESALLACELLAILGVTIGLCLLAAWRGVPHAGPSIPLRGVLELVGLALAVLFGLVTVPWSLSLVAGEWLLVRTWPLIAGLTALSRPLLAVADGLNTFLHRVAGRELPSPDTVDAFAEELQSVVDEGEREGVVERKHGEMIQRVMELHEEDVQAVMTPRTDIVFLPVDASLEDARRVIIESGHSRIPVIGETADDIVGILYARDLLEHSRIIEGLGVPGERVGPAGAWETDSAPQETPPITLRDLVRDPLYVPETTSIERMLEQMKASRTHVAIVLDEYGGVTGLVTLEDLLEEIVGSIEDEFDERPEEQIHQVDENTIDVDGRVHVDELNEQFAFQLPEDEDFDTVGGFVFSELGRIPAAGEQFRWRDLEFTVLEADKRRIIKLRIHHDRTAVEAVEER